MGNLTIWLTPVWILSLGVTAAALVLVAAYGILWLVSRPTAEAALRLVRESVLLWVSYLVMLLVGLCVLLAPTMPVKQVLHSMRRLPAVGEFSTKITVPAAHGRSRSAGEIRVGRIAVLLV